MEIDGAGSCVEHLYDQPVYQLYQFAGGKYTLCIRLSDGSLLSERQMSIVVDPPFGNDMVSIVADSCNNRSVISCSSLLYAILAPPLFR